MSTERQRVCFSTSVEGVHDLNPGFAIGKMRIAYVGDNRNGSSISKEVLRAAIPTMFNCPVVARYDRETNTFGSHDIEIVLTDNTAKIVNATQPVGVIPAGAECYFEEDQDANGVTHEYLSTNVILWKRQEAYAHICEVGQVDESMECVFEESHIDDRGYLVADKMYFEAFCLLESAKPCYEGASVAVFSEKSSLQFKRQYARMMSELAQYAEPTHTDAAQENQKGGDRMVLDDAMVSEILAEFGVEQSALDFEITDTMTVDEFREKVSAFAGASNESTQDTAVMTASDADAGAEAGTDPDTATEPEAETFAATYNAKRDALVAALKPVITSEEEIYYYLCDFDDTYAYVERNTWTKPDYNVKTENGRIAYTYDSNQRIAILDDAFEPMIMTWLTIDENTALEQRRALLDDLIQFREMTETNSYRDAVEKIFADFKDLTQIDEFNEYTTSVRSLVEDADARPKLEDVRDHCYCIRGKRSQKFTEKLKNTQVPRVSVAPALNVDDDADGVGALFKMYD